MAKFELSEEAKAAGLSLGQNQNIREEDRQAALAQFRAQMSSEDSPYIRDIPQNQSVGLSDAQAAQLMGRPVNAPQARRPAAFESGYPIPRIENYVPFEGSYPGPKNVRLPVRNDFAPPSSAPAFLENPNIAQNTNTNPSAYLNSRVNPYVQDAASNFLSREDRAYQNAPMSPSIVNNPARERFSRAVGEGSENVYEDRRREAVNARQMPSIFAKQARDELTDYRSGKKSEAELRRLARAREKWSRENGVPMDYDSRAYEPDVESERIANRATPYKKGGAVKKSKAKLAKSKASKRGDGIAQRGKTKGRMV
jgi:hypothetical protein